ncbi:BrnT family toxin [Trichlorobacter lovleyi]|jgi:hypothetical protein|uniref:BrnT family toxin n=1 Tax=Trichlorobacter lovleyi (strain ATCC BAA-1151 / DSM 17278 / SZ) TaxID=398767 RepID=B3E4B6_TRIL1|nr:BrnT family toxin [Trichlorobacter lovleyi]ACD95937.1 protein of unknown function DUF497 [Trichlorobacter lovleyi SZ]
MSSWLFEWDEIKNKSNKLKHGVSFETAAHVFNDPLLLSVQDRHIDGEERWQSIGMVNGNVLLLVAHLFQEDAKVVVIRIVSARKATAYERRRYEEGI